MRWRVERVGKKGRRGNMSVPSCVEGKSYSYRKKREG